MSVFTEACFLFLRTPDGGVSNLQAMKTAGFGGVFCNIKDHPPDAWEAVIRPRALNAGMFCGPWAHTRDHTTGEFDYAQLDRLMYCADDWGSPVIVNSEAELNHTGAELTREIAEVIGDRDAAISTLPDPMQDVDWTPFADIPVLPQLFGPEYGAIVQDYVDKWHTFGPKCVFPTFATYSGWTPDMYPLVAPYSLYTADDCGGNFNAWRPTSYGFQGCVDSPTPVPPDGGDMQQIGSQDGITASVNKLRDLDPTGTLLVKGEDGKWPAISTLPEDLSKWKAWDKLQRTLQILKDDHDAGQTVFDDPF